MKQPEETSVVAGYISLALIAGTTVFSVYQLVKFGKELAHAVVEIAEDTIAQNNK